MVSIPRYFDLSCRHDVCCRSQLAPISRLSMAIVVLDQMGCCSLLIVGTGCRSKVPRYSGARLSATISLHKTHCRSVIGDFIPLFAITVDLRATGRFLRGSRQLGFDATGDMPTRSVSPATPHVSTTQSPPRRLV